MQQPAGGSVVDDNGSGPHSLEETSVAGETFEAGPSSRLEPKQGTSNVYYVVTDDFDAEHANSSSRRMGLFRRLKFGSKNQRESTEASPIGDNSNQDLSKNHKQKQGKVGFFGRLRSKKSKSKPLLNDAPATPKAQAYVPSMLTPITSPYSDNVTPSGLNTFNATENSNDIDTKMLLSLPPKMQSSDNSISSISIFASKGQDNASFTDVTHATDSDISPSNSPSRFSQELTPLIICNVVDDGSMSKIEETDASSGKDDGNECQDESKALSVLQEPIQKLGEIISTDESKEATSAVTTPDIVSSAEAEFVSPLVVENGDEFEMEYAGVQTTEMLWQEKNGSTSTTVPETPIEESGQTRPTNELLFLKVDSKESEEDESVVADETEKVNNVNSESSAPVDGSAATTSEPQPREKRTMVNRLMSLRNNNCERSQDTRSSNKNPETPPIISAIVSEEEIATMSDYDKLSPQYVVESHPDRKDYDKSSKPIALAKLMMMKTKRGDKSSADNNPSLASDTDVEDGTIQQDESIIDHDDDDRSESSFTFLSNDSTYFSEASNAGGCGLRGVNLQDLNEAVEDVREGVMDMVAAVRSTPIKQGSRRGY